jgi:sortase A
MINYFSVNLLPEKISVITRSKVFTTLLLVIAIFCLGKSYWISGKAVVAQWLIANAWSETLESGQNTKPWSWADTWPIAMLITPQGEKFYVLDSFSGQALAFGPGWLTQSAAPGTKGNTIIAAHRDTHFQFMEIVQQGDQIQLQDRSGKFHEYVVSSMEVVDSDQQKLEIQHQSAELTLITCYPFHSLSAGGSLRYVVHARLSENNLPSSDITL